MMSVSSGAEGLEERKGFLSHGLPDHNPSLGKSEREGKQEQEAEAMEEHCLLTGSESHLASFLIYPGTTGLGMVLSAVVWALLRQLTVKPSPHKHAHRPA